MKQYLIYLFLLIPNRAFLQTPQIQWQQCIGGSYDDYGNTVLPFSNGNILIVGNTYSNNGVSIHNHGAEDILVCLFDSLGNMIWRKNYGGSNDDGVYCASLSNDGGVLISGFTKSYDGDVHGYHFSLNGDADGWILKLNSLGTIEWTKCLGGSNRDELFAIIQLTDGNILCAGETTSDNGDVSGYHDTLNVYPDAWVVKLNTNGNIIWQKCFGNTDIEGFNSLVERNKNCYAFAGYSSSQGGDVTNNHGSRDMWLLVTDSSGIILTSKSYGGSGLEEACSLNLNYNKGYIISGRASSVDGDVTGLHNGFSNHNYDFWTVKTDSSGNILWNTCAGGDNDENARFCLPAIDGGYLLIGDATSNNGDLTGNYGSNDVWIIKMDSAGNIRWQKNYGGQLNDRGTGMFERDGSIYFCATTFSIDGDVSLNNGLSDIWLVKISLPVSIVEINSGSNEIVLSPNPCNENVSLKFLNESLYDATWNIEIFDNQSRKIYCESSRGHDKLNVSIENLEHGIYFIKLNKVDSGINFINKFIVE